MPDTTSPSDDPMNAFRPLAPGEEISPAHNTWMTSKIERTLQASREGRMKYRYLAEAMKRFGFDAR